MKTIEDYRKEITLNGGYIHPTAMVKDNCDFKHPLHLSIKCEIHHSCMIGKYTFINGYSVVYTNVEIGNYCTIARNCEIGVASHPVDWLSSSSFQYSGGIFPILKEIEVQKIPFISHKKTIIGNDVWIGAKVLIVNGVKIGDGAVIAAGAVVTKDVAPYSIVGGVPAKEIKKRFSEQYITQLLELKWWKKNPEELHKIKFDNIELAIKQLKEL